MTIIIIHLDFTKWLFGTNLTDVSMPFECFMFKYQINTLFQELGKTKSLVLSIDLFDLSMQNNISTNGNPTPEDGEHGASTILFSKASGLPHPSSNGGKGAMLELEF